MKHITPASALYNGPRASCWILDHKSCGEKNASNKGPRAFLLDFAHQVRAECPPSQAPISRVYVTQIRNVPFLVPIPFTFGF